MRSVTFPVLPVSSKPEALCFHKADEMISKKDLQAYDGAHCVLLRTSDFICLRPNLGLHKYISNYNITFPAKTLFGSGFTLMPSGCATLNMEIDGKNMSAYVDGPTTKPYMINAQANQFEVLITIEFKPAGLYTFTGINQSELTDMSIPLDAISPKLHNAFAEVIEKSRSIQELATSLDSLLLENAHAAYHPQLELIYQNIFTSGGTTTIKDLSSDTHYSERQLTRIFNQHVGISTKSFARLIRINNALSLLKKPQNSLTLVSDATGFYDLSHFTRDFVLVCGTTPQEYRSNMSAFYNNTTRF